MSFGMVLQVVICTLQILKFQLPTQASGHHGLAGACTKGCQGPLLRTVQRYGTLGCRFTGPSTEVQRESCVVKKKQNR